MAGPYFVDPRAAGSATGADWTNAFTSLAAALAVPPAAGEIIYCRKSSGADEVTAGTLALASSGTNAAGWIKLIGCNSSGVMDGTRYVIDANGGSFDIFNFGGYDMWWLENIEVKNTAAGNYDGFTSATSNTQGNVFINCCANGCGGNGFDNRIGDYATFIRCVAYGNYSGFNNVLYGAFLAFCVARDNTNDGFTTCADSTFYSCLAQGNTDNGFEVSASNKLIQCVSDGNGDDGFFSVTNSTLYGADLLACRSTNGDTGFNLNSEPVVMGWCYAQDNSVANLGNQIANMGMIPDSYSGGSPVDSNLYAQADTDDGYLDQGNNDFSTKYVDAADPTLRRKAITLPWS